MEELVFITGNEGKAKYLSNYFHIPVSHKKLDLPEIQSLDVKEIVEDKVRRAYDIVKKPVLVEDASLIICASNGLPGPLIKWFYEALGNDGLCKFTDSLPYRDAIAEVCFAYCDENGVETFYASKEGTIADVPRGDAGYGFDPIFIPSGSYKTRGEMSDDERHETSMRKVALQDLADFLTAKE